MRFAASETLPDVVVVEPLVHEDARGYLAETWRADAFAAAGIDAEFVQDNRSVSRRGCLRGLHYQVRRPQGKLVQVVAGRVYDVAVDLRRASPTFGRSFGLWLTPEPPRLLWIPPGFAHGFYVASESATLVYKCTELYSPEDSRVLRWDDPELGIEWPLAGSEPPLLSPADAAGTPLAEAECFS